MPSSCLGAPLTQATAILIAWLFPVRLLLSADNLPTIGAKGFL